MLTLLQPNFVLWHTIIIVVLWNDQIAVLKVKVTAKFRTSFIEYLQVWKNLVVSMFLHRKLVDVLQDYTFLIFVPLSQSLLLHSSLCFWQEEEKWGPVEQYWKEVRYRAVIVWYAADWSPSEWLLAWAIFGCCDLLNHWQRSQTAMQMGLWNCVLLGWFFLLKLIPHGNWGTD